MFVFVYYSELAAFPMRLYGNNTILSIVNAKSAMLDQNLDSVETEVSVSQVKPPLNVPSAEKGEGCLVTPTASDSDAGVNLPSTKFNHSTWSSTYMLVSVPNRRFQLSIILANCPCDDFLWPAMVGIGHYALTIILY